MKKKKQTNQVINFKYHRDEKILAREIQLLKARLKNLKNSYDYNSIKKIAIENQLKILLDGRGKLNCYERMVEYNFIKDHEKKIKKNLVEIGMIKLKDGSFINQKYIISVKKSKVPSGKNINYSKSGPTGEFIYCLEIIVPERKIFLDYKRKKTRDEEFDKIIKLVNKK